MKTKLITILSIGLFLFSACKEDNEFKSLVTGNLYSDCFSNSPLKNRKLKLIYSTKSRQNGTLAETTTDANGFFKFIYEHENRYAKIKIEDVDLIQYGVIIVDNIFSYPNRTKMKVYYQSNGKLMYKTAFNNTYNQSDTLYYRHPGSTKIKTLVGPFNKDQIIDSLLFPTGKTHLKFYWGIGYADFRKNFKSSECYHCIPIEQVACGQNTFLTIKD